MTQSANCTSTDRPGWFLFGQPKLTCCNRIPSIRFPALRRQLPQSFVNDSTRHHYYQVSKIQMDATITRPSTIHAVAVRARRRIMRRILPYLFFIYIIAFLDRVNVGYAALEMSKDLRFSAEVYGFGAGIFFIGYFLLEIPGSLIVEHWSARKWIARIMVTWGLLAIGMGFIKTPMQFYVVRFFLGAAEAGFFPGIIVYLSHWFRYADRAKAVAL